MTARVALGLLVPLLGTTLGSGCVYFMSSELKRSVQRALTGFAAGAMLYVVVEELIPEMSEGEHSNTGVIMFALGFALMMSLDAALG